MPKAELILLALDESPSLQLMLRALQAVGYEVAILHESQGLENTLEEATPALLLIGERFDSQNGVDVAGAVLDRFPTLPILLFAEKDTTGIVKAVLKAGLSGYLYPPLKTDDLVAAVQETLARASHLGDWIRREVKRTTSSLKQRVLISEAERDKLEAIIANIEDGVIVLDDDRKILFLNRIVRGLFDLGTEDLIGRPVQEVIPHPDLKAFLARSSESTIRYHEINLEDGRIFNAQYSQIPNIGSAITMLDITHLKKLDQMKSDFVHTVSHDLRSPLTAVMGYTDLIERAGPLSEQQLDFLRRMQISINSITSLINDLLDLERLDAGFDTRREPLQLEGVLLYTLEMLDPLVKQKNIEIHRDLPMGLPPIRANPIRIRQMLDNLLNNAIKYTPDNGRIHVGMQTEDHQVIIEISDTGLGIPADEQARIFDKFYRASNVTEKVKGTGLGLAIVKSIVASHQGRVWVESKLGVGSRFFVVLPAFEESVN